jgi:tryptophan synthase alpha subunit
VADGAVVGSALIDTMAKTIANGSSEELATDNAISLLKSIRNGVDNVPTGV